MTAEWRDLVAEYKQPKLARSLGQLFNTVVPYLALWGVMVWSLQVSLWLTIPLAVIAGGLLVRTFIIFHDCTHGSFFRSKRANEIVGFLLGILTFTSFHQWRRLHTIHHGTSGDLDRRGFGDVWTLTVDEYLAAPWITRLGYRLMRSPLVLFLVAPLWVFLVDHRIPSGRLNSRERRYLWLTNAILLGVVALLGFTIGWPEYLLIQLVVVGVAAISGVWLFYVQHQYEGVYWARREEWDFVRAALDGSSYYELPRVLQWFSGNIGFHHLHHLSPAIPNYNLEACHRSHPLFRDVPAVTLRGSLKSLTFRLWDEREQELVGFSRLRRYRDDSTRERAQPAPR